MRRWIRTLGFGLGFFCALSGCGSMLVSREPPERIYWLEAAAPAPTPQAGAVTVALVPGLDSRKIWILQQDGRLNYFAGAVWQENLGRVLPSIIGRSLQASTVPDQHLDVLVERFFAIEAAPERPPAVVLRARLAGRGWICVFETQAAPATDRLRDIVQAHQHVLDELTSEVDRLIAASGRGAPGC